MKKSHLIIAALIIGMMASVSSCKKKTVDPEPTTPTTPTAQGVEYKEPTEDQLTKMIECETVVYGEAPADDRYAQAVKNRLVNVVGAYNHETTNAVVIFAGPNDTYTEQDYYDVYDCYKKGGDVIIINPSIENFVNNFRNAVREKGFSRDVERYNTQGITHEQWMKYAGKKLMRISDSDSLLIVENAIKCLGLHAGGNYVFQKTQVDDEFVDVSMCQAGIQADCLAEWLNSVLDKGNEKFGMKFSKDNDLTENSVAEVQVRDYNATVYRGEERQNTYPYYYIDKYVTYPGVVRNVISVYAAHSLDDNIDWYQVDQDITFRNNRVSPVPNLENNGLWFEGVYNITEFNENNYDRVNYITCLAEFSSKMHLSIPGGAAEVLDSHPQSENGSMEESCSTTYGIEHSVTSGHSCGLSLGFSGGTDGFGGSLGFSFGWSHSTTTSEFFSTTTGSSRTINDMSVVKNTILEDGVEKVKWDYKFKKPSGTSNWEAAPLSITDCGQQNSMYYRVLNPSGVATIHCDNSWKYYFYIGSYYNHLGNIVHRSSFVSEDLTNSETTTFTLKEPVRYVERWGLSCIDYGDIAGNIMLIDAFEGRINQDIIGGSNNRVNQVGGSDNNDITLANSLLNLFVDELAVFSESYAACGFTGTFTFKMESMDTHKVITKSYTIAPPTK